MAPTARDLYADLIPVLNARQGVNDQALRVVCAAIRERHADAKAFTLQVDPSGDTFQMKAIITADDVHRWKRPAGYEGWGNPGDVLEYAPRLLHAACLYPFLEHHPDGTFWVDMVKAEASLARLDEAAARQSAHRANVVVKRFPVKPGMRHVRLGRNEVDVSSGWMADPAAFTIVVIDGKVFVDVTVHPLPRGDSRDVDLSLGMFGPGADRAKVLEAVDDDRLTEVGTVTVDGVTFEVVALYVED